LTEFLNTIASDTTYVNAVQEPLSMHLSENRSWRQTLLDIAGSDSKILWQIFLCLRLSGSWRLKQSDHDDFGGRIMTAKNEDSDASECTESWLWNCESRNATCQNAGCIQRGSGRESALVPTARAVRSTGDETKELMARQKLRGRVRIELTQGSVSLPRNGFEDRTPHQRRSVPTFSIVYRVDDWIQWTIVYSLRWFLHHQPSERLNKRWAIRPKFRLLKFIY